MVVVGGFARSMSPRDDDEFGTEMRYNEGVKEADRVKFELSY
jgi:hypothetical protein